MGIPGAWVLWLSLVCGRRDSLSLGQLTKISRWRNQLDLILGNSVQFGARVTLTGNLTSGMNSTLNQLAVMIEVRHLVGIRICRGSVRSLVVWLVLHLSLVWDNHRLLSLRRLSNLTLHDLSPRNLTLGKEWSLLISSGGFAPHLLRELHGLRPRIVPDWLALRSDRLSLLQQSGATTIIFVDSLHGLVQILVGDALAHLSGPVRIEGWFCGGSRPLSLLSIPLSHLAFPRLIRRLFFGFQKLCGQLLCCGSGIRRQLRPRVILRTELRWSVRDEFPKSRLCLLLRADLTQPAESRRIVSLVGCKGRQIAASHSVTGRVRQGSLQIAVRIVILTLQEIGVSHIAQQVRIGRVGTERSQVMPFRLFVLLRLVADPGQHVVRVKIRWVDVECLAKVNLRVLQPPQCQFLIAT